MIGDQHPRTILLIEWFGNESIIRQTFDWVKFEMTAKGVFELIYSCYRMNLSRWTSHDIMMRNMMSLFIETRMS